MTARHQNRDDIQILRGLAVLSVVLFHGTDWFKGGYLGVNIFFVISGFLTGRQIIDIAQTPNANFFTEYKYFLRRRAWRLLPAFLGITAIGALIVLLLGPVATARINAYQLIASLAALSNLAAYKWSNDYFTPVPSGFIHLWSLSVEVVIYVLLPFILFLLVKLTGRVKASVVFVFCSNLIIFLVLECYPKTLSIFGIADGKAFNYYMWSSYAWQYAAGMLASIYCEKFNRSNSTNGLKSCFLFLLAIAIICIGGYFEDLSLSYWRIGLWMFLTLVTCLLLVLQLSQSLRLQFRFLKSLGNWSYSVYLVHMPVIYLMKTSPLFIGISEGLKSVLGLFLAFALGKICYREIELRAHRWHRNLRNDDFYKVNKKALNRSAGICALILASSIVAIIGPGSRYILSDSPERGWLLNANHLIQENKEVIKDEGKDFNDRDVYVLDGIFRKEISLRGKTVLLAGDSHAGALAHSLLTSNEFNIHLFLRSGCNFAYLDWDGYCPGFAEEVERIIESGSYSGVIIANRFQNSLETAQAFSSSVIRLFHRTNIPIFAVGPVPEVDDDTRLGGTFWQTFGEKERVGSRERLEFLQAVNEVLKKDFASKGFEDQTKEFGKRNGIAGG